MRKILCTTFILFHLLGFAQNIDKNIVSAYLKSCNSKSDIDYLYKVLGNSKDDFKGLFAFIPSINPLNPKLKIKQTSGFGRRLHPIYNKHKMHFGIDIKAAVGTPVHAVADGIVFLARKSKFGYGNRVKIKHKFGFVSVYAHMFELIVNKGFKVKKGDIIGFVGSTGASTGNHLHFEILKNNKHVNPKDFLF